MDRLSVSVKMTDDSVPILLISANGKLIVENKLHELSDRIPVYFKLKNNGVVTKLFKTDYVNPKVLVEYPIKCYRRSVLVTEKPAIVQLIDFISCDRVGWDAATGTVITICLVDRVSPKILIETKNSYTEINVSSIKYEDLLEVDYGVILNNDGASLFHCNKSRTRSGNVKGKTGIWFGFEPVKTRTPSTFPNEYIYDYDYSS